ncbi:MAG: alkaline phosphatase family protein [Actinomycetota bacterium]
MYGDTTGCSSSRPTRTDSTTPSFRRGVAAEGRSVSLPGFGGRVGLLALSAKIHGGRTVTTSYDHMSLLRTVEDAFGIGEHLNDAARAPAMSDVLR